jgi:hypothetical protein
VKGDTKKIMGMGALGKTAEKINKKRNTNTPCFD